MLIFTIATVLLAAALMLVKWRVDTRLRTEECSKVVNAQLFAELVDQEIKRASRSRASFSLVYMETRDDDSSNGTRKDETLAALTATLLEHLRKTDVVARLGDGVAVLMPETRQGGVQAVMRKIKTEVARVAEAERWPATIGTCAFTCDGTMLNPLQTNADALISEVRKAGRENMQVTFLANNQPDSEESAATVRPAGGDVQGGP